MTTVSEALASAVAHLQAGRLHDAEELCRRVLAAESTNGQAWHLLGYMAHQRGQYETAVDLISRSLEFAPNSAAALNNLGLSLHPLRKYDDALASYQRAIKINQDSPEVHNNIGNVLKDLGQPEAAIASYRRSLELRPDNHRTHSNLLTTLLLCCDFSAAEIYAEHRRWNERFSLPLAKLIQPHPNDRTPNRRLRIGYVSPDFRIHCQAFFMVPLLANHNRQNFEIVCYSDVPKPDIVTDRLRSLAQQWQSIVGLNDDQVARLIRQDQIDILVDLTMHMEQGRPLLFARKPAPVQVCWLAYPGTTGQTAIDYRLTDPQLDPIGSHDEYYTEQSIRLPETFWCYDPLTSEPLVNALPALENGYITFGSLNNFCKVNDGILKLWARVLKAVDRSRLLILAPEGSGRDRVRAVLHGEGIDPDRVAFVPHQPMAKYLATYNQIDIGLDTLPYNGHTTSLDAFWMGVPVVTLVGETVVGRAGLSQLTNLKLTDLIAHSEDEYVRIVAGLAADLDRLAGLRQTLRGRMQQSPLMNAPRFATAIESDYRQMWQNWCGQDSP
ncbi:MAG TPA: tetratricopeptide repeat protein [Pirellulaceae bacterium]